MFCSGSKFGRECTSWQVSYPTWFRTAPLSRHIGSGSVDGMVKLYDAATGRELLTLTRQKAEVNGVAFSPDARRLTAATVEGAARVDLLRLQNLRALAQARVTHAWTTEECRVYLHILQCLAPP